MRKITAVIPGEDYRLTVRLDNNNSVTIDLKEKPFTVRFAELRDRETFCAAAKTNGKSVYWPGGFSLDLDEILETPVKQETGTAICL